MALHPTGITLIRMSATDGHQALGAVVWILRGSTDLWARLVRLDPDTAATDDMEAAGSASNSKACRFRSLSHTLRPKETPDFNSASPVANALLLRRALESGAMKWPRMPPALPVRWLSREHLTELNSGVLGLQRPIAPVQTQSANAVQIIAHGGESDKCPRQSHLRLEMPGGLKLKRHGRSVRRSHSSLPCRPKLASAKSCTSAKSCLAGGFARGRPCAYGLPTNADGRRELAGFLSRTPPAAPQKRVSSTRHGFGATAESGRWSAEQRS